MVWLLSGESRYQCWRPICWSCLYDAWQKWKKQPAISMLGNAALIALMATNSKSIVMEWGEIWPFFLPVMQYTSGTVCVLLINTWIVNNCCTSGAESKVPSQHQCRFSLSTLRFSFVVKITSPSSSMLTNTSPRVVSLFNKSSPSQITIYILRSSWGYPFGRIQSESVSAVSLFFFIWVFHLIQVGFPLLLCLDFFRTVTEPLFNSDLLIFPVFIGDNIYNNRRKNRWNAFIK